MAGIVALLSLATLVQVFFSWNNHLPTWFWFQEVSINFGVYWLVAHLITLALLLALRKSFHRYFFWAAFFFLGGFSASYLYQLRTFLFMPVPNASAQYGQSLKVLLVSARDARFTELEQLVGSADSDVVGILGLNAPTAQALRLAEKYPYSKSVVRDDEFGLGLYSRFPISADTQTSVGERLPPIVSTKLTLAVGRELQVLLFHAPSPLVRESYRDNRLLVRRASTPLRQSSGPLLVFGNFNATEFSVTYKRFRNAGDLSDAMAGHGYWRSWDAESLFYRLSLDHVMYRDVAARSFLRLPSIGSKHFPILAEFAW